MSDKTMTPAEWAFFLAGIHATLGSGSADVVRRFVAGEIAVRPRERLCDLLGVNEGGM